MRARTLQPFPCQSVSPVPPGSVPFFPAPGTYSPPVGRSGCRQEKKVNSFVAQVAFSRPGYSLLYAKRFCFAGAFFSPLGVLVFDFRRTRRRGVESSFLSAGNPGRCGRLGLIWFFFLTSPSSRPSDFVTSISCCWGESSFLRYSIKLELPTPAFKRRVCKASIGFF